MPIPEVPIQPTVAMPSADLITYRFDQTDKNIAAIDAKIDAYVATFATKEEVKDEMKKVNQRLDNWTKYGWSVFITLLIIIGGLIAAFIERGHK